MVIKDKHLRKKAKMLEKKRFQKFKINAEQLPLLDQLLEYIYVNGQPKARDYYNRKDLVRIFNEISKEIYGKLGEIPVVLGFGSFLMDIFTTKSDLDLSVNFSDGTADYPLESKIQVLRKFAKKLYALQRKGHVTGVQPILSAKVPILKVADYGTGIECDISVENRDGVLKSQIVRLISSIDQRFQRLSFLMKVWAKANDINSSKDRTLNSLSIVSLVAFHLQTRKPPILPPLSVVFKDGANPGNVEKIVKSLHGYGKENKESLGELFISLLVKLVSVENLWRKGLCASTYKGYWIRKTWDSKISHMSVEDFTDRSENVSRAVGEPQLKKIYKCIHLSLQHVSSYMVGEIDQTKLKESLFVMSKPAVVSKKPVTKHNRKKRKAGEGHLNDAKSAKVACRGGGGEGWESKTERIDVKSANVVCRGGGGEGWESTTKRINGGWESTTERITGGWESTTEKITGGWDSTTEKITGGWDSTTERINVGWEVVQPNLECNKKVVVQGNGWGSWGGIPSKGWGSWASIPSKGRGSRVGIPSKGRGSWASIPSKGRGSWASIPSKGRGSRVGIPSMGRGSRVGIPSKGRGSLVGIPSMGRGSLVGIPSKGGWSSWSVPHKDHN